MADYSDGKTEGAEAAPDAASEPIFVARQPIFDRRERIWGYELLFRHSFTSNKATFTDADVATSKVIADGLSLAQPGIGVDKKLLVNFPRNLLVDDAAFALPPESCVVEILETVEPEPEVLESCRRLKQAGYTLALDDFVGQPGYEPLLQLADIVKVDILELDGRDIRAVRDSLRGRTGQGPRLLAEKVENPKILALTMDLGFELFQGYFFARPEIIPGRKLSSSQASKLQILRELSGRIFDVRRLAEIIGTDISLSYRLLRYINSASFGLRHRVDSIRHAILVLGERQLLQWLRVVILSDLSPSPSAEAAAHLSMQRARFLELLGQNLARPPLPPDSMFIMGLFSLLEVLLKQPMAEILEHLPLEDQVKDALQGRDNQARQWLDLAMAWEEGEWGRVSAMLAKSGLSAKQASMSYAESMKWCQEITGASCAADFS